MSYLFSAVSQSYLMVMKISGRAKLSVLISVAVVAVDMLVDFFLIYGIGGIPALGADGSAWSTIAVELLAVVWCLIDSTRQDHILPTWASLTYFSKPFEKDLWKSSLPINHYHCDTFASFGQLSNAPVPIFVLLPQRIALDRLVHP